MVLLVLLFGFLDTRPFLGASRLITHTTIKAELKRPLDGLVYRGLQTKHGRKMILSTFPERFLQLAPADSLNSSRSSDLGLQTKVTAVGGFFLWRCLPSFMLYPFASFALSLFPDLSVSLSLGARGSPGGLPSENTSVYRKGRNKLTVTIMP